MNKKVDICIHEIIKNMYTYKYSLPLDDLRRELCIVIGEDSVKKVESDTLRYESYNHCWEMAKQTTDVIHSDLYSVSDITVIAGTIQTYATRYRKENKVKEMNKYKDLKEFSFNDWDGKPFEAILIDNDNDSIGDADRNRLDGNVVWYQVVGYLNGCWMAPNLVTWKHAYRKVDNVPDKPARMTKLQLAKWIAKGNGQTTNKNTSLCYTSYEYPDGEGSDFVGEGVLVRPWGSDQWIEPTVDLL